MTLGVTVGKFYPFHKGHDYLIQQAKSQVNQLVVMIVHKLDQEISGEVRADWIQQQHPDVDVVLSVDDMPNDPTLWAERTRQKLGRLPDYTFTSETYGIEWANAMNSQHVAIDTSRKHFSISGSELRNNLKKHWGMLTPPVKAYFTKRVCCLGVESSGSTTLATDLAKHYQTAWIPEYGRWYSQGRRYIPENNWHTEEFIKVAKGQIRWEDDLALRANQLIVCDTDALATHIWHRRYVGHYSEDVEDIADTREYDLYIVTAPDFGFIQDGTRDGKHIRTEMHQWFIEELTRKQHNFIIVNGSHENRMSKAITTIDNLLTFPKLEII